MNNEYIKEKINHNRNIKDNLWTAFMITVGGTLGLALNPDNIFKIILIIIGLIIGTVLINSFLNRYVIIEKLLQKLKDAK